MTLTTALQATLLCLLPMRLCSKTLFSYDCGGMMWCAGVWWRWPVPAPNEGSLSYLLLKYANYTGKNSHVVMSQNLSFSNKASAAAASSWTGAIRNQDSDLQQSLRVQGDPSPSNFKLNVQQRYILLLPMQDQNIEICGYLSRTLYALNCA